MTVVRVDKDPELLQLVVTSQFDAAVADVWRLWSDPRLLEQWWGPPDYPVTVTEHDLRVGGGVRYFMTGPEGVVGPYGWWTITAADPPHRLDFGNGLGEPDDPDGPAMTIRVDIASLATTRTEMTITTSFANGDEMRHFLDQGLAEGMTAALGQIDALLTEEET